LYRLFFWSCAYCSTVTPSTPAAPLLLLTFSNAAATTCLEIANGFEPGSLIPAPPGTLLRLTIG
jgi:hypothetical protein